MKFIFIIFLGTLVTFLFGDYYFDADNNDHFFDYIKLQSCYQVYDKEIEDYSFLMEANKNFDNFSVLLGGKYNKEKSFESWIGCRKSFLSMFVLTFGGGIFSIIDNRENNFFGELSLSCLFYDKLKFVNSLKIDKNNNDLFENKFEFKYLLFSNLEIVNFYKTTKIIGSKVEFFNKNYSLYLEAGGEIKNNIENVNFGIGFRIYNVKTFFSSFYKEKKYKNDIEVIIKSGLFTPSYLQEKYLDFEKSHKLNYIASAVILMPFYKLDKYEYRIKKGDSLTKISRKLPFNVEKKYHNNPDEIAKYNNIKDKSKIRVNDYIILPLINVVKNVEISNDEKIKIMDLINKNKDKEFNEIAILISNWFYLMGEYEKAEKFLPKFGDMNSIDFLNIKAMLLMQKKSYKLAGEYWEIALKINHDNQILLMNSAQADYYYNDYKKAMDKLKRIDKNKLQIKWYNLFYSMVKDKL